MNRQYNQRKQALKPPFASEGAKLKTSHETPAISSVG